MKRGGGVSGEECQRASRCRPYLFCCGAVDDKPRRAKSLLALSLNSEGGVSGGDAGREATQNCASPLPHGLEGGDRINRGTIGCHLVARGASVPIHTPSPRLMGEREPVSQDGHWSSEGLEWPSKPSHEAVGCLRSQHTRALRGMYPSLSTLCRAEDCSARCRTPLSGRPDRPGETSAVDASSTTRAHLDEALPVLADAAHRSPGDETDAPTAAPRRRLQYPYRLRLRLHCLQPGSPSVEPGEAGLRGVSARGFVRAAGGR